MNVYADLVAHAVSTRAELEQWRKDPDREQREKLSDLGSIRARLVLLELQARRVFLSKDGCIGKRRLEFIDFMAELVEDPEPLIPYYRDRRDVWAAVLQLSMDRDILPARWGATESQMLWKSPAEG